LSRPVACSGRLKARQPFLVCYYYAIKDRCSSDTITGLPFGFQDGNETKMTRPFRTEYVMRAASDLPNQSARYSDNSVFSWSVSQANILSVVQFLQLLNPSVTQRLSQLANQIARNLTIQSGNESDGHIGLYNHRLASQSDR